MAIFRGTGSASSTSDQATIDAVTDKAAEAATSASNAATSASSASTSASSASSSASSASTSATTATTKASEASASASAANDSANAASTSETNAASSASSASTSASQALTSRNQAVAAQGLAEDAQTAAETAETNAASSASTASTAATTASSAATTATTKASEASTSATNAATSETNAATSETNAATSASSASTSATTATTKAAEASTSATSAATSETNAATSETNAATSASNAATSETNASNSATAAATSATNASTSETNASNSASAASTSATNASNSATAAQTAQTAAETALDAFDDRYLGAKASAPTVDNDGDPLITGALYYDTTASQLYIWDGSAWDQAAFSVSGAVTSFNTRTGAVTLSSGDVTTALGYTPSQASDITTAINNLVDAAPSTLDTLNELAAALGDDANFSVTITNSLATKAPLASPALTGTPTAPTAAANTNTTQLATTAYVQGELANEANWNTAYGWGDHSTVGYLTSYTETDPVFSASEAASITSTDTTNWDTAYGWGDHGVEGYLTGNQTITLSGDVSGSGTTSISVTVADDSHNHVISNIDNLQTTLDAKVPLAGGTMTGNLNYGDNVKAQFGAGSDLQIYHDSFNSVIAEGGTGNLLIDADSLYLRSASGENKIIADTDGSVYIFDDNSQKLRTTSTGIDVTGTVTADGVSLGDNQKAQFGASNDLQIYHDGLNSYIDDQGTGNLNIRAANNFYVYNSAGTATLFRAADGAGNYLYYNNAPKLTTTSDGVDITGEIYAYRGRGATHTYTTTATSLTPNMSTFTNFVWTLDRNITLLSPSTEAIGQSGVFVFIHSGAARTVSLATDYETVGGAGLTLSGTAGATDVIPYFVAATNRVILGQPLLAVS